MDARTETELINKAFPTKADQPGGPAGNSSKPAVCWACGVGTDAGDNFCRKCGKGQGGRVHWYYRHLGALLLTLAIGPFSLYFVWRSPILSRNAKLAYTAVISAITWFVARELYGVWRTFQTMFGGGQLPY